MIADVQALGHRLQEAFVHAGYLVGLHDGLIFGSLVWLALIFITQRLSNRRP